MAVARTFFIVAVFAIVAMDVVFVDAQRFLREGFSNQMESDFRGEMKVEDGEAMAGMTREMFLLQDNVDTWELEPPVLDGAENGGSLLDGKLRRHIRKYLHSQIQFKLLKKKGRYGMRAIGVLPNGQKLRGFWRQGSGSQQQLKSSDFLTASYDDAVRSRLFVVEFEVQLPPISPRSSKTLPSVVYQVAVEPGTMNPKSMIPRGTGKIRVFPEGHESSEPGMTKCLDDVGSCNVGLKMRAGLIDPTWARGHRPFFRKGGGRSPGLI